MFFSYITRNYKKNILKAGMSFCAVVVTVVLETDVEIRIFGFKKPLSDQEFHVGGFFPH